MLYNAVGCGCLAAINEKHGCVCWNEGVGEEDFLGTFGTFRELSGVSGSFRKVPGVSGLLFYYLPNLEIDNRHHRVFFSGGPVPEWVKDG